MGELVMSGPSYRAEVVGSLLRPKNLVDARRAMRAGKLLPDQYQAIEDRAVDEALRLQERAGIDVVTDGEMRRDVFFDFLIRGLSGLEMSPGQTVRFHSHEKDNAMEVQIPYSVTGRITARECPGVKEYEYAAQRTKRPLKVTLPSPGMMTGLWTDKSKAAYPDAYRLMEDAAGAVEAWMRQLAAAGCTYIQIDAPELNEAYVDKAVRDELESRGISADRFVQVGTNLVTALGDVVLPGVRKALHICKGNGTQSWIARGGYEDTAKGLLQRARGFDVFLMEFDDERSGNFEPLRHVADDKMIVLGLVSSKWTTMESPSDLKRRISQAAKFHALDRLALSAQCGFASAAETADDRLITEATQFEKLKLISKVARSVWK
jgi:5-methyltetrahydropteroyltriglutamate--homocysteine methyltransferase